MKPEFTIIPNNFQNLPMQNEPIKKPFTTINISVKISEFLRVSDDGWTSEYNSVNNLLLHLKRKSGSLATRRNYLQRIMSFCIYAKMKPEEIIKLPKENTESLIQKYTDRYNTSNFSKRTANNALAALKTFYEANGFKGLNALQIEGYHVPTRYRKNNETIPQKHEIYQMADCACSLRNKAIVLTLYSSGIRTSTLAALTYKDIKEDLLKGIANLKISIYPEMKNINSDACKNSLPYYTFICDEATEAIRLYLQGRTKKYGLIMDNDPLFASDYNQIVKENRKSKFLTQRQIQILIKESAKLAGINKWENITPKCLRKSYETVTHSETFDGYTLDSKIQEFLMGHVLHGSQDNYFDRSKIEQIRMEYSKLKFNRITIENKFKTLRKVIAQAFEGTGEDPDKLIEDYILKKNLLKKALTEKT
ncbi:MAG: tyrosine-type recombinase/integrase [Candidatus Aenigmarchaeota archaeon]|nr:tyrosine-type recombinase/integrase [Candidatus Aenigmarchaeota archaeon]